jgi:hypothetical protein
MQIALVKRQPKRRCRIPRRPHPNLDYFFGRLERIEGEMRDDAGPRWWTWITRSGHRTDIEICFLDQADETALPELPEGNDQGIRLA